MRSDSTQAGTGNNTNTNANASSNTTTTITTRNNRNSRYCHRLRNQMATRFVPKIEKVKALNSNKDKHKQDFTKFQKSLHHHVMSTYTRSLDLADIVIDFVDPIVAIEKESQH